MKTATPNPVAAAELGEWRIANFLALQWDAYFRGRRFGFQPGFDFEMIIDGRTVKIEVKEDFFAERSGKVYLETHKPNTYPPSPSGLRATVADLWAFHVPSAQRLFLFEPKAMLAHLSRALAENRAGFERIRAAGDLGNSGGVLVHLDAFRALVGEGQPFHP